MKNRAANSYVELAVLKNSLAKRRYIKTHILGKIKNKSSLFSTSVGPKAEHWLRFWLLLSYRDLHLCRSGLHTME